jgi:DNA-binding CsgD family transcriptional regulator
MIGGSLRRRGQTTTLQERLDITERTAAGESDPEIAAALGCSVWTVRTWCRRGQRAHAPGRRICPALH